MNETTMFTLDKAAADYSDTRADLAAELITMNESIEAIKRAHMKRLKELAGRLVDKGNVVRKQIEELKPFFDKPKTRVFHGVKCGYRTIAERIAWVDGEALVASIEKEFGKHADDYLLVKKEPSAAALKALTPEVLTRLGVAQIAASDMLVMAPVTGDVEKAVAAFLEKAD